MSELATNQNLPETTVADPFASAPRPPVPASLSTNPPPVSVVPDVVDGVVVDTDGTVIPATDEGTGHASGDEATDAGTANTDAAGNNDCTPGAVNPVTTTDAGGGQVVPEDDRPIIPAQWRSVSAARAYTREVCRRRKPLRAAGFHAVRVPVYWARLAARAPHGIGRIATLGAAWVVSVPVLDTTPAAAEDAAKRRKNRAVTLAIPVLLALAAVAVCWLADTYLGAAVTAVLLSLLGWVGWDRREDLTDTAVDETYVPPIDRASLVEALSAMGVPSLKEDAEGNIPGLRFAGPIARDGNGYSVSLDLPKGVLSSDIAERREKLAAGLRRPLSAVWPQGNPKRHPGRLDLWVADDALEDMPPVVSPLASAKSVNIFDAFPIGESPRGQVINTKVITCSGIIGAQPRMGKTFGLRVMALAAALDPRVELHIYDLKGGADLIPLAPICHRFRSGSAPEDIAYLVEDVRAMQEDMNRRYAVIRGLTRTECPEGEVTDDLASRRDLGLHPVWFSIDECQVAYAHAEHGAELIALVDDLARRGPAAGYIIMNATQRPTSDALPAGIGANASWRMCLKVAGQVENDLILGTSAYKSGRRASTFGFDDKGLAYITGDKGDAGIVRLAYMDAVDADKIVSRALATRTKQGRLTGYATGEDHVPDTSSILDHLIAAWPEGTKALWCEEIAPLLAETYPASYAKWTTKQVAPALRPFGVETKGIKKKTSTGTGTANRRGVTHTDLLAAADAIANPPDITDSEQQGATEDTPTTHLDAAA